MKHRLRLTAGCTRRTFLRFSANLAAASPIFGAAASRLLAAGTVAAGRSDARVAIVSCRTYDKAVAEALRKSLDLLGGIGWLVKDKTVTVKLNLTGTNFSNYFGRPVGETYMTHPVTVLALNSLLFDAGARRVRYVESTNSKWGLENSLSLADWDLKALAARGPVEFENTRNLGKGKRYARLKVPGGGYYFSAFDLNHAYEDTDVMVSLSKLKNHVTAGVTMSLKNLFGITPNALYGDQAGDEDATGGRSPLHNPTGFERLKLPGLKPGITATEPETRVPHIVADICAARPIHLSIIDAITSISGGEGPWCADVSKIRFVSPGVLIVGLDPVATDAVGTAVMGYPNPRATRGTPPFTRCENHLWLAEKAGVGTADLARIDVRGLSIEQARHPYDWTWAG
jgi:uncharacterized protein (DUF362 family)